MQLWGFQMDFVEYFSHGNISTERVQWAGLEILRTSLFMKPFFFVGLILQKYLWGS